MDERLRGIIFGGFLIHERNHRKAIIFRSNRLVNFVEYLHRIWTAARDVPGAYPINRVPLKFINEETADSHESQLLASRNRFGHVQRTRVTQSRRLHETSSAEIAWVNADGITEWTRLRRDLQFRLPLLLLQLAIVVIPSVIRDHR